MRSLKYLALAILLLSVSSCKVRKNHASNATPDSVEQEQTIPEGFEKGMVSHRPENIEACRWFIELDDQRLLEPLDLPEEFQKDSLKVWISYMVQRRPSRCLEAQPVGINEIRKRE